MAYLMALNLFKPKPIEKGKMIAKDKHQHQEERIYSFRFRVGLIHYDCLIFLSGSILKIIAF